MKRPIAGITLAFNVLFTGVLTNAQENFDPSETSAPALAPAGAGNVVVDTAGKPPSVRLVPLGTESADVAKPEDLQRWSDWVLRGLPGPRTPRAHDDATVRIPLWSSRLKLDAAATGATFSLRFESFENGWLLLPGSPGRWPEQVRNGSGPVPVVEREGRPAIRVEARSDTVT
ncbi:MAG: hypothetical protein KGR69_06340, partial [Verrucomicrobia bacterium]|nr:hypothetical protein [Verrucomicrobiota bacterium]